MTYQAQDIAEYVLWYSTEHGYRLSALQLMKMLYFVQAQFLFSKKQPAFCEPIIAKDWGPVVYDVWNRYNGLGNALISVSSNKCRKKIAKEDATLIEDIVEMLLGHSNSALLAAIWDQPPFQEGLKNTPKNEITKESMAEFFK